ncbi:MAG: transporter [Candidatus Binataceae bacterium]
MRFRWVRVSLGCLAFLLLFAKPAQAQHGDWLMGTNGLLSAQQAPEGIFYSDVWSYYHVSGSDFVATGPLKCSPHDMVCLSLNLGGSGSLDEFVDQNIIGWTSPYKVLGANYGLFVDVPFAIADARGTASLQPVLSLNRDSFALPSRQSSAGVTKGSIADIYVEPVNFGWHLRQLDAIVSSGFFAPSGPYRSDATVNIGDGHWTGVFGLGGTAYADADRTWSLSIYAHYLLYGSQMGRSYTLGDVVPFEWGAGKYLNLNNDIFKQLTLGAVGYAQWQVTNNQIDLTPKTKIAGSAINTLANTLSQIYSAGPAIYLLTKYGLFSVRYYEEFDAHATPSGRQLMFSLALAFG